MTKGELLIRLAALAAALVTVAIAVTMASIGLARRGRPVLAVEDPTEDLMGVAGTLDVQPEPTYVYPPVARCIAEGHTIDFRRYENGRCTHGFCPQCRKHLGNDNQGHYWSYCKARRTIEAFHFCCPGACELGPAEPEPEPEPVTGEIPIVATAVDPGPSTTRPYVMGGWTQVGAEKLHRSCVEARRDGRPTVCAHCSPYLVGSSTGLRR